MEHQKLINVLIIHQLIIKIQQKNWLEINDELRRKYKKDHQIRFKNSMFRATLCDYTDAYIVVSGTITVTGAWINNDAR